MTQALTLLFYFAFIVYFFMGIYTYNINKHEMVNKLYSAVCFLAAIWSIGFSIAASTDSENIAMIGFRFAALGWGAMYSVLLHFVIVLSNKKKHLKIRTIILIYIPAIITVFSFALYSPIVYGEYLLELTPYGYVTMPVESTFAVFFQIYYLGFFMLSIAFMTKLGIKGHSNDKKVSLLFTCSLVVSFVSGVITDSIFRSNIVGIKPQIGPLSILLPMGIILFSIKKYGFLLPIKYFNATLVAKSNDYLVKI